MTCQAAAAAPADEAMAWLELVSCLAAAALQGYTTAITVSSAQLTTSQPNVVGNVAAFARQADGI